MKRIMIPLTVLSLLALASCGSKGESVSTVYEKPDTISITSDDDLVDFYTFDENNNLFVFTKGGDYTISGSLEGGSIVFADTVKSKVTLTLEGFSMTSDCECILWKSEDGRLEVKAKKDTINSLTTSSLDKNTISCKNNLELSGKGELTIQNEGLNAVSASDIEIHSSITLNVKAATKDCFHAKEILVHGGIITASAKGDIFEAETNSNGEKGNVTIEAGTFTFTDSACMFNVNGMLKLTGTEPVTITASGIKTPFKCTEILNESENVLYTLDGDAKTI